MRETRSVILDAGAGALFHTALVYAVFLLVAGHNSPGGGFAGGLVAGAAFVLRFVQGGTEEVRRASRLSPQTLLGGGLLVAAATAVAPLLFGGGFLESGYFEVDLPVIGHVKAASALAFDVGVFLVVVGVVQTLLATLGSEAEHASDPVGDGS